MPFSEVLMLKYYLSGLPALLGLSMLILLSPCCDNKLVHLLQCVLSMDKSREEA